MRAICRSSTAVTDAGLNNLLINVAAAIRLKRTVRLLISQSAEIPSTWGIFRPVVILPADIQEWPLDRQRTVLCHELAHVKRFDMLTNFIADLACLLYWFNPLVWMATRALRYERERACDDYVLACGEKPSVYASALLELSERLGTGKYSSPAIAMAHQHRLERRLLAILASDISRSQISRSGALIACCAAIFLTLPLAAAQLPEARKTNVKNNVEAPFDPQYADQNNNRQRPVTVAESFPKQSPKANQIADEVQLESIARNGAEQAWPIFVDIASNHSIAQHLREQAIDWITRQSGERALRALSQIYDAEKTEAIKGRLAEWFAQSNSDQARLKLIEIARSDNSFRLREMAIDLVARQRIADAANTLSRLYDEQKEEPIREKVLDWLGRLSGNLAMAKLIEIARSDQSFRLRERAVEEIARRGGADTAGALSQVYDYQKEDPIKEMIIDWLARLSGNQARSKLIEIAHNDNSFPLRQKATEGIARRNDADTADSLSRLYDEQKEESFKERIIDLLGRIGGKAALDKLFAIAKGDSSPQLRQRAIYHLGQSKDPGAVMLLQQLH
jgi:HEAT repeat protein